jgi:two-component system, NtrC family, C4-dicarboxylate transport response regulator DctD
LSFSSGCALWTTKVDLGDPAARGGFRSDLYYRLNVVALTIPPLRDRRADAPMLLARFLRRAAERFGRPVPEISPAIRDRLERHGWPGNVREFMHYAEPVALGLKPSEAALLLETTGAPTPAGTLPHSLSATRPS